MQRSLMYTCIVKRFPPLSWLTHLSPPIFTLFQGQRRGRWGGQLSSTLLANINHKTVFPAMNHHVIHEILRLYSPIAESLYLFTSFSLSSPLSRWQPTFYSVSISFTFFKWRFHIPVILCSIVFKRTIF